jgi:hypothetical protein
LSAARRFDAWEVGSVGWIILGILLGVSSVLNAFQVVSGEDPPTQVARGVVSLALATLAALSLRKALAERSRFSKMHAARWPPPNRRLVRSSRSWAGDRRE